MPRLSPEARRQAMIEASIRVVQQKGFAATSVRDIAKELGTSSGLIHHYFESFDDLLSAAFDHAAKGDLEWLNKIVNSEQTSLEKLCYLIKNYTNTDNDWLFQFWLEAWSEAERHPALQKTSRKLYKTWHHQFTTIIEAGVSENAFKCKAPEVTVWRLLSLLEGLAIHVFAHNKLVTKGQMTTWTLQVAELELGLKAGVLDVTFG